MKDYQEELYRIEEQVNQLVNVGCYRDALSLQHTYVHLALQHYGVENQRTLDSMVQLGYFHRRCGHFSACRYWYERCLDSAIPVLGESHEITCRAFNNLGTLKYRWGLYEEGVDHFHRAIGPVLQSFGITAVNGLHLTNLATTWRGRGDFELAVTMYQIVLWLRDHGFLTSDFAVFYTYLRYGELLMTCNPADAEAEKWLTRACDCMAMNRDRGHPDWVEVIGKLVECHALRGDCTLLPPAQRMRSVLAEKLGEEHPETGHLLLIIGRILLLANQLDEAESTLKQAILVLSSTLGQKHVFYWMAVTSLARIALARKDLAQAENLLYQSLQEMELLLGSQNPWLAETMESLADCLYSKGDFTSAEILRYKASTLKQLPPDLADFAKQAVKCLQQKKYLESIVIAHAAEFQAEQTGDSRLKVRAMETRASSCTALGWTREAMQAYEQAGCLRLDLGDDLGIAYNLRQQAEIITAISGRDPRARHLREQADRLENKQGRTNPESKAAVIR